jgi:hypothetical protein
MATIRDKPGQASSFRRPAKAATVSDGTGTPARAKLGTEGALARHRHADKDIEAAIRYAESRGWVFVRSGSHGWGVFRCPHAGRDGHQFTVLSTPRVPRDHAERFRRVVNRCQHRAGEG